MKKRLESLRHLSAPPEDDSELYRKRLHKSVFMLSVIVLGQFLSHVLVLSCQSGCSITVAFTLINLYFFLVMVSGYFILPYRMRNYGFNLEKWNSSLKWGLGLGLFGAFVGLYLRFVILKAEFSFGYLDLLFPIFVLSQEAVTRGFFQSYLVSLLGKNNLGRVLANLLASVLFASMHAAGGFAVMAVTFGFSLVLGAVYERTRSLLGVYLIHLFAGGGFLLFSNL